MTKIRTQIKTKDRVRSLAEVYTHEREVHAMLDLVADMFPSEASPGNHDRTFLEPSCGSGNFLEEILRRKLATVTVARYGSGPRYEHRVLRCLTSIYGIDIDHENVIESRDRLRAVIASHLDNDLNTRAPSDGLATAVELVLGTNVIQGDTLRDASRIRLVAYAPGRGTTFKRTWSTLEAANQPDLFAKLPAEEVCDAIAIDYRLLSSNPGPVGPDVPNAPNTVEEGRDRGGRR